MSDTNSTRTADVHAGAAANAKNTATPDTDTPRKKNHGKTSFQRLTKNIDHGNVISFRAESGAVNSLHVRVVPDSDAKSKLFLCSDDLPSSVKQGLNYPLQGDSATDRQTAFSLPERGAEPMSIVNSTAANAKNTADKIINGENGRRKEVDAKPFQRYYLKCLKEQLDFMEDHRNSLWSRRSEESMIPADRRALEDKISDISRKIAIFHLLLRYNVPPAEIMFSIPGDSRDHFWLDVLSMFHFNAFGDPDGDPVYGVKPEPLPPEETV